MVEGIGFVALRLVTGQTARISRLPKSLLAKACHYTLAAGDSLSAISRVGAVQQLGRKCETSQLRLGETMRSQGLWEVETGETLAFFRGWAMRKNGKVLRAAWIDFPCRFNEHLGKSSIVAGATIQGIHHVTAIATDPQTNLDFYARVLGLRLVKKTVNFDDPGTYHFYFADEVGTPGTVITFFPWPVASRGSRGTGQVESTAFSVPPGSTDFWLDHLRQHHVPAEMAGERFGETVIRFLDPDGLQLELIGSAVTGAGEPWRQGGVPLEEAIRGVHSVSAALEG
jgi:catechol 2,3-dioxygenase-like lactoylglutathione lyase family enzyme